jgi:hypothetical protein
MYFSIQNRSLIRGLVAGAVALVGTSACSRSDRAGAGHDTTQTGAVAPADTQAHSSTQPATSAQPTTGSAQSPSGAQPAAGDTAMATPSEDNSKASRTVRHAPTKTSVRDVAGYKAMAQDSSAASSNVTSSNAGVSDTSAHGAVADTVAATSDTAATDMAGANADTAATEMAGANPPMARDTSVAPAQGDSVVQARVDTSSQAQGDTATIGDTAVILAQTDTTTQNQTDTTLTHTDTTLTQTDTTHQAEMAVAQEADTTAPANDSTAGQPAERVHPDTVSQKADELAKHEPARVRPPEDSTEVRGNVTTDRAGANADAAAVGAAGVASTGNVATGAEAVALLSRQGESCMVAAPDQNRDVLWDMASSPSTLNPCGTGTMTLPRIWTGENK